MCVYVIYKKCDCVYGFIQGVYTNKPGSPLICGGSGLDGFLVGRTGRDVGRRPFARVEPTGRTG